MTLGYDGFPSTLMTLRRGCPGERNAFCRKRLAAAASRLALRRKSIVAPVASSARYKHPQPDINRSTCPRPGSTSRQLATTCSYSGAPVGSVGSVPARTAGPSAKSSRDPRPGSASAMIFFQLPQAERIPKYQRTQRTMISALNCRPLNSAGRLRFIPAEAYQTSRSPLQHNRPM